MVNERIRALRKALRMTQQDVANRTGIRRTNVVRLESGALKATLSSTRRLLGNAFGMSLDVIDDYLEGVITLEDALAHRTERAA
jgi:transcriptional regulator with XRE-family HTH domain